MTAVTALETSAEFAGFVNAPGVAVVEFWADWCAPCRQMAPILEAVAADRPATRFAKANADRMPEITTEFRISSLPATLVFKNGQLVDGITGAKPRTAFESDLERLIA